MRLFNIGHNGQLENIREQPFKLEKDIQRLTEKNLMVIFGLDFVRSEFSLHQFRIDTLAFDREVRSFAIIEYKRDQNFSIIDQGFAYLSLMLNNKADFILEFNEHSTETLQRKDVDWSQSKVIFISPSFTPYQKEAVNFKNLPIELWEIRRYSNQTVAYDQMTTLGTQESLELMSKQDKSIEKIAREVRVYTESDHINKGDIATRELYEKLKSGVVSLDDNISFQCKKLYISFRINSGIFCDISVQAKSLKIFLNLKRGELIDEKAIARDISGVGHWGNGDYEIKIDDTEIDDTENLEYILSLIKQSVELHQK